MPTFEFECMSCGKKFELLVGVGREKAFACPVCGCGELKRLITAFRIGGSSKKGEDAGSARSACSSCSASSCGSCGG